MKLHVGLAGVVLGITCFATGCIGPGLSHHGRFANPVGTTNLTNANDTPARATLDGADPWTTASSTRALDSNDPWAETAAAPAPARTWGVESAKE